MTKAISPRSRKVRILATLGPASNTPEMIERLFHAGADAFRINMSHGDQASKLPVFAAIRGLEKKLGPPQHGPRRPPGAEAARRQVRRGQGDAAQRA